MEDDLKMAKYDLSCWIEQANTALFYHMYQQKPIMAEPSTYDICWWLSFQHKTSFCFKYFDFKIWKYILVKWWRLSCQHTTSLKGVICWQQSHPHMKIIQKPREKLFICWWIRHQHNCSFFKVQACHSSTNGMFPLLAPRVRPGHCTHVHVIGFFLAYPRKTVCGLQIQIVMGLGLQDA